MNWLAQFVRKLGILLHRERFNRELEEEMTFHREQMEQELTASGMAMEQAHRASSRQFGNAARISDESREVATFKMESVAQDFRFAMRQLRRNPGFAATAVLVLALGIAASVAIFAFVDAALLKPLPYAAPSRLAGVYESSAFCPKCNLSYPDYLDWKKDNTVFSSLDAYGFAAFLWKTPAGVQSVLGTRVSDGFFHTLGVTPALGRVFNAGDDTPGAPRTVVIPYGAWQRRFGGRQDILGQSVTLDDNVYTVIGVLPKDFNFAPRGPTEFWTTFHDPTPCEKRRGCHNLFAIGRLKEGVSLEAAFADMRSIAAQLEKQYPDSNKGQGALVMSLRDVIVGDIRPVLLVLLCGAGMLLLIACVNVGGLLLVRAEGRRREMALRGALGASRGRLLRQFVTEGLVLVIASLALGLSLAYGGIHLLLKLIPAAALAQMPYLQGIGLTPRVLASAFLVVALVAAVFSMTPSLRLSVGNLRQDLADGGRCSAGTAWKRLGANLVVFELAIAVILLVGAGLLGKSFYQLLHVDLNFNPDHLALVEVDAPDASYGKAAQSSALSNEVLRRVGGLPGVVSVAHTSDPPVTCNCDTTWFRVQGHPYNGEHNEAPERSVSVDYFKTIQAKLMRGRFFTDADNLSSAQVVIINHALAKKFFPGEDPIGKVIGDTALKPESLKKIVGVVDDIREGGLDQEIRPAVYYPFAQTYDDDFVIVARTAQDPKAVLPAIVKVIHNIDPNIGARNETTMTEQINDSETAYLHRSSTLLVSGFAVLALLMSVVGLYGVTAYSVSQRTREIGVRMALGAQRGSVYRLVLGEAGWLAAVGIGVGLACSVLAATLMRKLLFGVSAWDATTLAGVVLLLAVSALLASYIPARRAASVNPVEALRSE